MRKPKASPSPRFPEFDLGARIAHLRKSRAFSQATLARAARVSQPTIAQIESGQKDPSVQTLRALARALDVEVPALFASDGVYVFDLKRLRRKYNARAKLTPHLYMALGEVIAYAREIGMVE